MALDWWRGGGAGRMVTPRFGLGALGAAMVGNPGLVAMVNITGCCTRISRPGGAAARCQRPDRARPATGPTPKRCAGGADRGADGGYTALMAATQPLVAAEVLAAYPLRRHRCLLDIGGGEAAS